MKFRRKHRCIERFEFYYLSRFIKKPDWPDLTTEAIEIVNCNYRQADGSIQKVRHALFTNFPPDKFHRFGWVPIENYFLVSDLAFSLRYPSHEVSENVRKMVKMKKGFLTTMLKYGFGSKEVKKYNLKHPGETVSFKGQ